MLLANSLIPKIDKDLDQLRQRFAEYGNSAPKGFKLEKFLQHIKDYYKDKEFCDSNFRLHPNDSNQTIPIGDKPYNIEVKYSGKKEADKIGIYHFSPNNPNKELPIVQIVPGKGESIRTHYPLIKLLLSQGREVVFGDLVGQGASASKPKTRPNSDQRTDPNDPEWQKVHVHGLEHYAAGVASVTKDVCENIIGDGRKIDIIAQSTGCTAVAMAAKNEEFANKIRKILYLSPLHEIKQSENTAVNITMNLATRFISGVAWITGQGGKYALFQKDFDAKAAHREPWAEQYSSCDDLELAAALRYIEAGGIESEDEKNTYKENNVTQQLLAGGVTWGFLEAAYINANIWKNKFLKENSITVIEAEDDGTVQIQGMEFWKSKGKEIINYILTAGGHIPFWSSQKDETKENIIRFLNA